MNLEAAIFDMDGLIIDSEPLWRKAEIAIFKEVSIFLTNEDCESTAGLRIDEVVNHWFQIQPWDESIITKKDIETKIVDTLISLIKEEGKPLPGIPQIFDFFKSKGIPMAIASSSQYRIINTVVDKLNIGDYFELIYSAEDEEFGKPHPGIFISSAEKLNVLPTNCIVFEDSFNGILAGMSARMKVIAVPEQMNQSKPKFQIANLVLNNLTDFGESDLQQLI